jgi:anti-sigma factor RsiW
MTCRELIEFLADYLSGELPAEERRLFEEHLAECPDCVAYLETYEATIRLGKGAFSIVQDPGCADAPEELVAAIMAARRRQNDYSGKSDQRV